MNIKDLHMLFASKQIDLSTVWQDVDPNSTMDDLASTIASILSKDPSSLSGLIAYGTKAHWASIPAFVPLSGQIVIWADKDSIMSAWEPDKEPYAKAVPGIKVGDGLAANVDLPFVGDDIYANIIDKLQQHAQLSAIHVTEDDRKSWNHKITIGDLNNPNDDGVDGEELIITRN